MQITESGKLNGLAMLPLNSSQKLQVQFDDLDDNGQNYSCKIIHCNANWETSTLKDFEYLGGLNVSEIENTEFSFNTLMGYAHYSFEIPNRYQVFKKSGNYKVQIYPSNQVDQIVAELPFRVYENLVHIQAEVNIPKRVEYRNLKQEISIRIRAIPEKFQIQQAFQNLKVYVQQNRNTLTYRQIPYQYASGENFEYKDIDLLIFDGLNEYRNFDIRPLDYAGRNVKQTRVIDRKYQASVWPDVNRLHTVYIENEDLNGDFAIKAAKKENSAIEADYALVDFLLESEYPLADKKVYVVGQFNAWELNASNQMSYNYTKKAYTYTAPFKQGFYDYMYVSQSAKNGAINCVELEGNHQETENDYYIFAYYRNQTFGYDQLIGVLKINSRFIQK
ncbi:MAG: DUF5103 domain-containing protein [Bacteroidales bacterium]